MRPNATQRELEVLAAWSHMGSVVGAARLLGITEQRAKNVLHMLRIRSGCPSNIALYQQHWRDLPNVERPTTSHNVSGAEAAHGIGG